MVTGYQLLLSLKTRLVLPAIGTCIQPVLTTPARAPLALAVFMLANSN